MMKSKMIYTIFNVISYVFLLVCSFMVNGATAFTVAGAEPLITPAPYAFFIWLVIYLLFGIWIIKFGFKQSEADEAYIKVSRFLPLSLAFAGGSLLVGQPVAALCILGSLITAIFMYIACQKSLSKPSFFRVPLSIYLGWVSIASLVEISIVLKSGGFTTLFGLPEPFIAIIILVFAGFLAITFLTTQNDFLYPLVFIWSYVAIAIKNVNHTPIFMTCCGVILLIAFMMDQMKKRFKK